MNKRTEILISVLVIIVGWLLDGLAFSTEIKSPDNTILLLLGIIMFIGGVVFLIKSLNKK